MAFFFYIFAAILYGVRTMKPKYYVFHRYYHYTFSGSLSLSHARHSAMERFTRIPYALLFYNLLPLSLLVPQMIYAANGDIHHYQNYSQLQADLQQTMPIQALMRIIFSAGILFCKLLMIIEIVTQQIKYKHQIIDENGDLRGIARRNKLYLGTGILLIMITIGQLVPSTIYHALLKICIIFTVIAITRFLREST